MHSAILLNIQVFFNLAVQPHCDYKWSQVTIIGIATPLAILFKERRPLNIVIMRLYVPANVCRCSSGEQGLEEFIIEGCKDEITSYCKDVTLGQQRILACIYAHNDKLSGKCDYDLYGAAGELEKTAAVLSYVINECAGDLNQFYQDVGVGNGQHLKCLEQNDAKVSSACKEP